MNLTEQLRSMILAIATLCCTSHNTRISVIHLGGISMHSCSRFVLARFRTLSIAMALGLSLALVVSCGGSGGGGGSAAGGSPGGGGTCSAGSGGTSGSLDTTFASVGYVTKINTSGTLGDNDFANAVAVDSNCAITAAGASLGSSFVRYMTIWRYQNEGTLDTSFAGTGYVVKTATAGAINVFRNDLAFAMSARGGEIVTMGRSNDVNMLPNMAAWRYTTAGAVDTSFNSTGYVTKVGTSGGTDDQAFGGTTDSSGNLTLTGISRNGGNQYMAVWRYLNTGAVDTSFASPNGYALRLGDAGAGSTDQGYGVVLDGSGRTLVTGYSGTSSAYMMIWRFKTDGTLDTTGFGGGSGFTKITGSTGSGTGDAGRALILDGSGNIVVVGQSVTAALATHMAVWRYTSAGVLDTTFGTGGVFHMTSTVVGGTGQDIANAVAIDGSGRIVVAGTSRDSSFRTNLAVWRLTSSGALDTTFGSPNGFVTKIGTAGASGDLDQGNAVAIDSQGRIIVAGVSQDSTSKRYLAIWRFNP